MHSCSQRRVCVAHVVWATGVARRRRPHCTCGAHSCTRADSCAASSCARSLREVIEHSQRRHSSRERRCRDGYVSMRGDASRHAVEASACGLDTALARGWHAPGRWASLSSLSVTQRNSTAAHCCARCVRLDARIRVCRSADGHAVPRVLPCCCYARALLSGVVGTISHTRSHCVCAALRGRLSILCAYRY